MDGMPNQPEISQADVRELIARMDDAAAAYIRGDLDRYVELFDHGSDYSLMPPYGGDTRHGFEYTEEAAEETRRFFASGEATLEVEQTYVSGDLVVLVAVERQHGEVGGLPHAHPRRRGRTPAARPSGRAASAGHRSRSPGYRPLL